MGIPNRGGTSPKSAPGLPPGAFSPGRRATPQAPRLSPRAGVGGQAEGGSAQLEPPSGRTRSGPGPWPAWGGGDRGGEGPAPAPPFSSGMPGCLHS